MRTNTLLLLFAALAVTLNACGNHESPTDQHTEAQADTHAEDGDEHAEHEDGAILLTDEQASKAGLELLVAQPESIREQVMLYGTIVPNAERVREVSARFPGVIQRVAKKVGDAVKEGERMATVESNESLRAYPVVAPISGVVTARNAYEGEQAADKPLFTVADLSSVWAEIALFPKDLSKVRVGQPVEITSSDDAVSAQGKVIYVAPLGTRANQTITARVLLDNSERQWAPGLYVTARVTASETKADVAVCSSAIQRLNDEPVVFVKTEQGFELREVRLGQSDSKWTQVLEGVKRGEPYVAQNSFILKAELGKGSAEHDH